MPRSAKIKKRVRFGNEGLEEYYCEITAKIESVITNGFYATDLEKKIKEGVAIQIPGLGDKDGKIPLEPEDTIKIIIKLKEKKT